MTYNVDGLRRLLNTQTSDLDEAARNVERGTGSFFALSDAERAKISADLLDLETRAAALREHLRNLSV